MVLWRWFVYFSCCLQVNAHGGRLDRIEWMANHIYTNDVNALKSATRWRLYFAPNSEAAGGLRR
jgi:hypothetical protein